MYKVIQPNYTKYWLILLLGLALACISMTFAIGAEQKIDDLRPRVTACYPITKTWCWEYTKFADSSDFQYYKELYEASK